MTACGAPKADGGVCGSEIALCPRCGHCPPHCEHRRELMQEARSKGGKARRKQQNAEHERTKAIQYKPAEEGHVPPPPETVEDAKRALSWLSHAVMTGAIGTATARDAATVLREFIKAVEKSDLEARLAKIENEMAKRGGGE